MPWGRQLSAAAFRTHLARLHREEDGVVALLTAVVLMGLLGVLALTVDLGYAYSQRRMAQNVADTGALAATHVIAAHLRAASASPFQDTDVTAAVRDVARTTSGGFQNSFTGGYVDATGSPLSAALGTGRCADGTAGCIPSGAWGVQLTVQKPIPAFFAAALGQSTLAASASATAVVKIATGVDTLSPSYMPYILWAGEDGYDHSQTPPQYAWPAVDSRCRDGSGTLLTRVDPLTGDPNNGMIDAVFGCVRPGTLLRYRDNGYATAPNVSPSNPRWTGGSSTFKGFLRVDPTAPDQSYYSFGTQGGNSQGAEDPYVTRAHACYLLNHPNGVASSRPPCTLVLPLGDYQTGTGSSTQIRVVGWSNAVPNEDPVGLPSGVPWTVTVTNTAVSVDWGTFSDGSTTVLLPTSVVAARLVK